MHILKIFFKFIVIIIKHVFQDNYDEFHENVLITKVVILIFN